MKQNYLKGLLCLLMMVFGMSAWADTATFDYSDYSGQGTNSTGGIISVTKGNITIAESKGYGNTSYTQLYANGVITVTPASGYQVTGVTITCTASSYNGFQSSGTITASTGVASGSGTAVTWTGTASSAFTLSHNKQIRMTQIVVTYSAVGGVADPAFSVPSGSYITSQSVELSTTTESAAIYYTTDGTDPTNASTQYTAPISVSSTTTIKAIAYKDAAYSAVATATYTFLTPYTTLAAAHTAAEATGTTKVDCAFSFTNVLVTAVTSSNAYIVDENGDAAVIYTNSHGFKVGDMINGTAVAQMQIYSDHALEFIGYKNTTEGLTVTSGNTVTPVTKALADVTVDDMCKLIKLEGVKITTATYEKNTTKVTDGTNEILFYNTFNTIGGMTFSTTASYDVVGIIPAYSTLEIAPRTPADVTTNLTEPTHSFEKAWLEVAKNGTPAANAFTTNASSTTYSSSDENIATVDANGVVALKVDATGLVTITATTAEDATYMGTTTTYSIAVVEGEGSKEHPYTIADVQAIVNASKTGTTAIKSNMYVQGTIVGSVNTSTGALITSSTASDHTGALALGSVSDYITVNMPSNIQKVAALKNDLTNLSKTVVIKGNIREYAKTPGVHSISEISGITDINVSSVGYATYYTNCAWVVPAGLTVKYVSAINAGTLTWEGYDEGATVPANTGVVVKAAAGDYPIIYTNSTSEAPTNLLKGSVAEESTTGGDDYHFYMLSLNAAGDANSVGFYFKNEAGKSFTNGAHKAYLALTAAQAGSVKAFLFETENADAIQNVATETENKVIYNLAGQRVNKAQKGLYIVNGKKVMY